MKIAVTGLSGYIGTHFSKIAIAAGHDVIALSRRNPGSVVSSWIPYDLEGNQVPTLPMGIDVVLHLAANTSRTLQLDNETEVVAAVLLMKAAHNVGAKFVFVSSQTARQDAPTVYGRTKWRIEQHVFDFGGWVVSPGQVYGGVPRGLFGELLRLVGRHPVLPAFLPAPMVQPIHVNDLALGMLKMAALLDSAHGVVRLASEEPVTFTAFLRTIARERLRTLRIMVPIPSIVVAAALRLIGSQSGLSRLSSLFELPLMDAKEDLRRLGLELRPLRSGMHPAGDDRMRYLLLEGTAILCYVLKKQPTITNLRSYVRMIESLRGGNSIKIPMPFIRWPVLLALIDSRKFNATSWEKEFRWRLDSATVLSEATAFGAQRFLGIGETNSFIISFLGVTRAVFSEVGWRILSLILSPCTLVILPRAWGGVRES